MTDSSKSIVLNLAFTIIFWAFVFWVTCQYLYALLLFNKVFTTKESSPEAEFKPISVVICAKNEAANLKRNLLGVLKQDYCDANGKPLFEIIVVDDESTDDTAELLLSYSTKFSQLKIVTIPHGTPHTLKGKKFALSIGVGKATNDILLLTDADCSPAGPYWLELMTAPIRGGKDIVAGYGAYRATQGVLNAFSRWETLHAFMQLAAYASVGIPYMASGRNIACIRSIFLQAQTSPLWNLSSSGDDDLLVRLYGNNKNYAVVSNPGAFTYTESEPDINNWIIQKQRHLSDGKSYRPLIKYLLGSYGFTHAATWVYFFPLMFSQYWLIVMVLMAVRCFLYWLQWARFSILMQERSLSQYLPFFDLGWMFFNFTFLPYIVLKNKQHWK